MSRRQSTLAALARNRLRKVRDRRRDGRPEIAWQPFFNKARDILAKGLLEDGQVPPKTDGD